MQYNYDSFIKDINLGNISEIYFSIKGYSHYNNCSIKRVRNQIPNGKFLELIIVNLTDDNSERVSFYETFEESYKLFRMGRKGSFTLKQIWRDIQIIDIKFNVVL